MSIIFNFLVEYEFFLVEPVPLVTRDPFGYLNLDPKAPGTLKSVFGSRAGIIYGAFSRKNNYSTRKFNIAGIE